MKRLFMLYALCLHLSMLTAYGEESPELNTTSLYFLNETDNTPANTRLLIAIRERNKPAYDQALTEGADHRLILQAGWTPLHVAAQVCFVPVLIPLLETGTYRYARVDIPNEGSQNPLDLILKKLYIDHAWLQRQDVGLDFFTHRQDCYKPFMQLLLGYYRDSASHQKIQKTMIALGWEEESSV